MKVSSSSSRAFFQATFAFSLVVALHTGLVLAITAPRLPASNHAVGSEPHAPLGRLGVDEEGNLLWSKNNNQEGPSEAEVSSNNHAKQPWSTVLMALRGGDLRVDSEGNFYTPRRACPPAATKQETATAASRPVSPTTEALRGGSHPQPPGTRAGEVRVDSEGNLFFASSSSSPAVSTATTLRGGDLCVDNEGNFFSPRPAPLSPEVVVGRRRRGRNDEDPTAVVLAKNERVSPSPKNHHTKIHGTTTSNKSSSKNKNDETPMAFIGYNNALMET